jgi:hypothetical protein
MVELLAVPENPAGFSGGIHPADLFRGSLRRAAGRTLYPLRYLQLPFRAKIKIFFHVTGRSCRRKDVGRNARGLRSVELRGGPHDSTERACARDSSEIPRPPGGAGNRSEACLFAPHREKAPKRDPMPRLSRTGNRCSKAHRGPSRLPNLKNQLYECKKFTTKAGKAHEDRGLEAYIHSFVFPASRSSPWCAFVINIPILGPFAYPVM